MTAPPPHARPLFMPGGAPNLCSFVVAGLDPGRADRLRVTLALATERLPSGLGLSLREESHAEFAAWFEALVDSPDAPGPHLGRGPWIELAGETPDLPSHDARVRTWGVLRLLCRELAPTGAVWDGLSCAWTASREVTEAAPDDRALVGRWRCDTVSGFVGAQGEALSCVHSLGLAKYGRRDLVAFGDPRNASLLESLVSALGDDLVAGAVLSEGDEIEKAGLRIALARYEPGGNAPALDVPFFWPPLVLLPLDRAP